MLIVAGEASADLHGARLVREMKAREPGLTFSGIGGKEMEDAGVKILVPSSEMAVVGLTEVFPRLWTIAKAFFTLRAALKAHRLALLILIDYPEFNIPLARSAKRCHVPVLYYICPQIWAWRSGRIKKLAERTDRMAVILPFEEDFYRRRGIAVDYVGHPLMDGLPSRIERGEVLREKGLERAKPILGLLPGSRKEEVRGLLPVMLKAAEIVLSHHPEMKCVLPIASTIPPSLVESLLRPSLVDVTVTRGEIYRTLAACDLALVASGTASLETAIMEIPMIVVYRMSPLSYWTATKVVHVPHIALANLVAGTQIVPEVIQHELTPERLAGEALAVLEDGGRRENMVQELRAVKERLGIGASRKTADIALEMISQSLSSKADSRTIHHRVADTE